MVSPMASKGVSRSSPITALHSIIWDAPLVVVVAKPLHRTAPAHKVQVLLVRDSIPIFHSTGQFEVLPIRALPEVVAFQNRWPLEHVVDVVADRSVTGASSDEYRDL